MDRQNEVRSSINRNEFYRVCLIQISMMAHEKFAGLPLCQKKSKQFCFFSKDYVIKGPYTPKRLEFVKWVYKSLEEQGAHRLTPPVKEEDGFLYFENLAKHYYDETVVTDGVIERKGLVKLGDVILIPEVIHRLRRDDLRNCLLNMVRAWLLGVSDLGFYNVLTDLGTGEVFLIDLDDQRIRETEPSEWFYLTRKPTAEKLRVWLQLVRPFYGEAIEILREAGREDLVAHLEDPVPFTRVGSLRSSVTPSGFALDLAKSTIQKLIRRGEPLALDWVAEVFRMQENGPIRTNLLNRISVIAMEDIGVANPSLVLEVFSYLNDRENITLEGLLSRVSLMVSSKKTRLCSHVYALVGSSLDPDPEKLRKSLVADGLTEETVRGARHVITHSGLKRELKRLWEPLLENLPRLKPLSLIHLNHHSKSKESPYFLILGFLLCLLNPPEEELIIPDVEVPEEKTLDFPPSYAYDMHTRHGRMLRRDIRHFIEVGTVVIPEDERFSFLKEVYHQSKLN